MVDPTRSRKIEEYQEFVDNFSNDKKYFNGIKEYHVYYEFIEDDPMHLNDILDGQ